MPQTQATGSESSQQYTFADLSLNVGQRRVMRGTTNLGLSKLSFEFLLALVEAAPNLVTHEEIGRRVWGPRRVITAENLAKRALMLRNALGDDAEQPRYFEVVRGQGYRLCCDVTVQGQVSRRPSRSWLLTAAAAGVAIVAAVLLSFSLRSGEDGALPSVAVLPFADMSEQRDQAYLADGIAEELINKLSGLDGLEVVSRTSSFALRDQPDDARELGRALNVEAILEGSVRKSVDELRIAVQLIDVETGFHLWGANFDRRQPEDIFAIQDEIAAAVVRQLRTTLGLGNADLRYVGTDNFEAFDAYLKGREIWISEPVRAIEQFRRAIESDAGYALPWAWMSQSYGLLVQRAGSPDELAQLFDLMMHAARRGVELGPDYWEAYNALAWARLGEGDWIGANEAFLRSVDLVRSSGTRMAFQYATYVETLGRMDETIERLETLLAVDPFNGESSMFLFNAVAVKGPLERFVAEANARGFTYEEAACRASASASYIQRGEADLVKACMSQAPEGSLEKRVSDVIDSREATLMFINDELESSSFISRADLTFLMLMAGAYGDAELAIELMREAMLRKGWGSYFLVWHDALSAARRHPAFKEFLRDYGLVEFFRETGHWNDYCRPVAQNDFECE